MSITDEVNELKELGLLKYLSEMLEKGYFDSFDRYLSFIELARSTEYTEVRDYAKSYAIIRGTDKIKTPMKFPIRMHLRDIVYPTERKEMQTANLTP